MTKIKKYTALLLIAMTLITATPYKASAAGCVPRFNPIYNVDWSMFVREFRFFLGICACGAPVPRVGFRIRYAEPISLIETTQKPFFSSQLLILTSDYFQVCIKSVINRENRAVL